MGAFNGAGEAVSISSYETAAGRITVKLVGKTASIRFVEEGCDEAKVIVFCAIVSSDRGVWVETGSADEINQFLLGVEAGLAMMGPMVSFPRADEDILR